MNASAKPTPTANGSVQRPERESADRSGRPDAAQRFEDLICEILVCQRMRRPKRRQSRFG